MEPIAGQRTLAVICGVAILGLSLTALLAAAERTTGTPASTAPLDPAVADVERLGRVLFTDYVFAFEITAVLLTIAVVGAVVLVRRSSRTPVDLEEFPEGTVVDARLAGQELPEDLEGPDGDGEVDAAVDTATEEVSS